MITLFKHIFAVAALCAAGIVFAAELKINDKVFTVEDNTFTKKYSFSTFDKAPEELKLAKNDFYKHAKYVHICGVRNPVVIQVTAPAAIKTVQLGATACNYADSVKRNYVVEYSFDKKEWKEAGKDNKGGGWAYPKSEIIELKGDSNIVYLRFRKVVTFKDNNGLHGAVVLKALNFTVTF